jgi:hypothetical protein
VLLSFLAACSDQAEAVPCPGLPVASLALVGTRTLTSCADGGPAAGVNQLYPADVSFSATISYSASGSGAALCVARPRAEPLVGARVGDQVDLMLETRGAVLAACSASCAVTIRQRVTGTLQRDPAGLPSGFSGTLVDQATLDGAVAGADCAPCTTPCQASYLLSGLPR